MPREILRLTSAGSVDDGKSTILARLLLDTGSIFEDQVGGIDTRKVDATTIADLLDGLESEREQGITIDVAHRYFDSSTRRYHLADSPGHEQYTRNMATAASHADAMLLVVDVRSGVKSQTETHYRIARLLGITQFVVAVNKMDLVRFDERAFFTAKAGVDSLLVEEGLTYETVPVSGLTGDNIVIRSARMAWFPGPTVLGALDSFNPPAASSKDSAFAIQYVQRVPGGGRRYLGSLLSGNLHKGQALTSPRYPGRSFGVTRTFASGIDVDRIAAPAEPGLEIDADLDLERGDVLSTAGTMDFTDQFEANLVWLDEKPGFAGRPHLLRIGHASTKATITKISEVRATGWKRGAVDRVTTNGVFRVNLQTQQRISVGASSSFRQLERFVLVALDSGNTVAAGLVTYSLRRADNLREYEFEVSRAERAALTGRQGKVAWLTGLSGSGKSTLANTISLELSAHSIPHGILDGDSLRLGLNKDLGFSEADRVENIRRTAEVAKMMADSGLLVLVSLISPYRADREQARTIIGPERFIEVFVDTPIELCERRDPKGLYQKARQGLLPHFTGVGSPYEAPERPDLRVSPDEGPFHSTKRVCDMLLGGIDQSLQG